MPRRFAPRNDMQKLAACPHNTWALPVYCRKASLQPLTPGMFLRTLRAASLQPLTRVRLQHVIANHPLQPLKPICLLHVIANQCAHWCGNPHPLAETPCIAAVHGCAHTYQACHCEPVRTLVWQSVLLAVAQNNKQHLRQIRSFYGFAGGICALFCAAAGKRIATSLRSSQ